MYRHILYSLISLLWEWHRNSLLPNNNLVVAATWNITLVDCKNKFCCVKDRKRYTNRKVYDTIVWSSTCNINLHHLHPSCRLYWQKHCSMLQRHSEFFRQQQISQIILHCSSLSVLIQNVKASPIHLILWLRSICSYNTTQYNAMTPTFLFQNSNPHWQTRFFCYHGWVWNSNSFKQVHTAIKST